MIWNCISGHSWPNIPPSIPPSWCPKCTFESPGMIEVYNYIKSLGFNPILRTRNPISLDIYVPERNFGIEFNEMIWESDLFVHNSVHNKKFQQCQSNGIELFGIFEDEWQSKKPLIKSMIKHRLGAFDGIKLHARDLEIKTINKNKEMQDFFNQFHIDGHTLAQYGFALMHDGRMVSCLSMRRNFSKETEIARFASDYNFFVRGGGGKLIGMISKNYQGPIVSYSNNRLSNGGIYKKLGFEKKSDNKHSYWYTDCINQRLWRFKCKRINDPQILATSPTEKKQGEDGVFSQKYFGDSRPLYQIHDYGHQKWELSI